MYEKGNMLFPECRRYVEEGEDVPMKIKMCSRREDGRYGFGFGVRVLHGFALGCYLEIIYPFFFFFFSPRTFFSRRVWLELFYWAASRHVPFIYRRLRMCRETGPSPSHCSLGAGWDTAGGWGEGGFGQHLAGKGLVTVCDGTRDAVKFQETGRIGGHSCMGDLGRPPVDQGTRE